MAENFSGLDSNGQSKNPSNVKKKVEPDIERAFHFMTESGQKSYLPQKTPATAEASFEQFWSNYVTGKGHIDPKYRKEWAEYHSRPSFEEKKRRFRTLWQHAGEPFMKELTLQEFIDKGRVFTDTDEEGKETYRPRAHFIDASPTRSFNLWETVKQFNPRIYPTDNEIIFDYERVPTDTTYTPYGSPKMAISEFTHSKQHAGRTQEEIDELSRRFIWEDKMFGDLDEPHKGKYGRIGTLENEKLQYRKRGYPFHLAEGLEISDAHHFTGYSFSMH